MTTSFEHIPVMAQEVEGLLGIKAGSVHVDCTLGLGGHAQQAAWRLGPEGRLIGIDQDDQAIARARARLEPLPVRVDLVKSNFRSLDKVLEDLGIREVDSFLFDLGVSSLQLDDSSRGFSFREDAPLDMRMDKDAPVSAFDLVNDLSEGELADIIWRWGEERFSRRIAQRIVTTRAAKPIATTKELADLILRSLPRGYQRGSLHPATRTFQALRIAVNRELEAIEEAFGKAFEYLKPGGRIAVIAFHSLEDRIIKGRSRELVKSGRATLLTKKPLRPSEEEAGSNPRARSARLRALERI